MITNQRRNLLIGMGILLVALLATGLGAGRAYGSGGSGGGEQLQDPTPEPPLTPTPEVLNVDTAAGFAAFTFAQLDQPTFNLRAPIDGMEFPVRLPYRWAVAGGGDFSYIELHFDVLYEGNAQYASTDDLDLSTLSVYVDDVLAAAFIPRPGLDQTVRVPIPAEAVKNPDKNRHSISLVYFGGRDCYRSAETDLIVYDDSRLVLNFTVLPIQLNLSEFPRPLIEDSFIPETVLIVVPDEYGESDLSTAATVAAAIGHRARGTVSVELITASEATPERLADSSAIIVGRPDQNTFLARLYQRGLLPTTLSTDRSTIVGPDNLPVPAEVGVLQMALSDASDEHTYLAVTGATDEAVKRAASALATLDPRYGLENNPALIEALYEQADEEEPVDTYTLAELGFEDIVFYGIGTQRDSVSFFVPRNWEIQDGASLTLSYMYSAQLSRGASSLTVELNGRVVGSAPIDSDGEQGEKQVVIPLPPEDFDLGDTNELSFEIIMDVEQECVRYDTHVAWMRIRDTSTLRLAHELATGEEGLLTFTDPISHLIWGCGADRVWMALPPDPTPDELNGLIGLAQFLGSQHRLPGCAPRVTMDADPNPEDYLDSPVVAIGRPTANPLIAMLNDALPQPFMPGEDALRQEVGSIVYRLPEDFSIGVIEALPSPWNPARGVTVVTGTTDEGVTWALNAISDRTLSGRLDGDISFVLGEKIESLSSQDTTRGTLEITAEEMSGEEVTLEPVAEEMTPSPTPEALDQIPDTYRPQPEELPQKLTYALYGLIGAGILVAVAGVFLTARKSRRVQ